MTTLVPLLLAYAAFVFFVVSLCKAAAMGDRRMVAPSPPAQMSFPQTDPGWVFGFAAVAEPASPSARPVVDAPVRPISR